VKSREEILTIATDLAQRFAERAAKHDAEGSFPFENFDDLRTGGYPALTVPVECGGWGASLTDALLAQETLATGDGSTALAIGMHVQTVGGAATSEKWNNGLFPELCKEIVSRGALVNSCASEPELGSPSRGGRPATTARRDGNGWIIDGRKTFASMAPALDYFIVPAAVEGEDQIARFLLPRQPGIAVEDTWDSMGMRSTASNDVVLAGVRASDRMMISLTPIGPPDPNRLVPSAWFALTVSAVYLGIAAAAQKVALEYAHQRTPTALGRPIATLEGVQRRLGETELALHVARSVLYRTAEQWDAQREVRDDMGEAIVIAKLTCTNNAIKVVDDAMRVVGGASMTHSLPLERYYRDVRAGLYHPPSDDSALPLLGRISLQRVDPKS
jgi:alkylation response protein AidB-like acyl-CoA dehydrogenase